MIDAKVEDAAVQGDHGQRRGIDHYPKTLHYAAQDENGKWVIHRPTLDVDTAGHTAEECAFSFKIALG